MAKQKFTQLLLLLLILKIEISTCDTSRVTCSMYENNKKCGISSLTITAKNYTFVPVAPDSSSVIKFELTKSIVSILTSNICTTFTKLNYFTAIDQHIEVVDDYAFSNCTEIWDINLEKNNIHKLGTGIFSTNKKLKRLHILGGSMEHIDDNLFSNLVELNQLLYSANGLKELPVSAVKNLKKLELLYLYSNDLTDLDAAGLVDNLPNLKSIYINDNNFHCDRLIEIIDTLKARNIRIHDHTYEKHMKKRDYIPRKISNIICLSQAQLEAEKMKKALSGSLEELKDLPLGKEVIQLKDVVSSGFADSDSEIVSLSNSLNKTSDSLNEQIFSLNGTLQNTSVEIGNSLDGLKADIRTVQQNLEGKLKDTVAKLQQLDKSFASLMDKYKIMNDSVTSGKITDSGNQASDSLSHNVIALWVCLVCLFLFIVVIGLYVGKKFRNVYVDEPFLAYENHTDRIGLKSHDDSFP